ncbi:MAG: ExbD/TolR family protein [Pirellulales bacterium]
MKLSKPKSRHVPEMDLTPMIDIVFMLLIFIITVMRVSEANREPLDLPELVGEKEQSTTAVVVNVMLDGSIVVSNNQIELADLAIIIGNELIKMDNNPDRVQVVIRGDTNGTCKTENDVIKQLAQLGISRVRLAVHVPE